MPIPGTNIPFPWEEGGLFGAAPGTAAASAQAQSDAQAGRAAQRQQASDTYAVQFPSEHQAAVRAALTALYNARDEVSRADDPAADPKIRDRQVRAALGNQQKAETEFANILEKAAKASTDRAGKTYDPDEKANWAAAAQAHTAQADLSRLRGSLLTESDASKRANIQSQIEQRTHSGNLADARLLLAQAKSPADIEKALAQGQSALALAQQRNQLTPALLAEHNARAGELLSRSKYFDARTDYLLPAQVDKMEADGDLKHAEAEQIRALGPVKYADLESRGILNKARTDQIKASINKWQLAPAADSRSPTLTQFQPSTGDIRGVANPGYVNPQAQSIKDTYAAIDQVQSQIASGQIAPEDADQLIANLKQSLQARARGISPEQYQSMQMQQAQFGKSQIDSTLARGDTEASQLLQASKGVGGLGGLSFTPHMNAYNAAGGAAAYQKAMELMSQIQPVTDRMSGLDALSKYAGAKALLQTAQQGGGGGDQSQSAPPAQPGQTPPPAAPSPGPTDQANQLLQASMSGRTV